MGTDPKHKVCTRVAGIAFVAIAATTALTNLVGTGQTWGMPAGPHHSFLSGPWELVVKMGLEGEGLRFPITVSDENKPYKFDSVLPVMGTPIRVKLEEYVPDLMWQTAAVKHPGGGTVARLTVKGKDLQQEIWLSSADLSRQSMSSSIGGVALRTLHDPNTAEKLMRELTDAQAVGILSVWPEDSNSPFEYAAKVSKATAIPNSEYKLTVLEYVPHYSIDTETKKVVSQSDRPVNPAVRVAGSDGAITFEQWLWAKFPSSPHRETKLPLRMKFADVDLRNVKGRYILVAARGSKSWLLSSKTGKKQVERAVLGKLYPFADAEYSFRIDKIIDGAIIKTEWKNNSDSLLHPALVATIEQNGTGRQTVLELDKPFHHKTKFGTLVLLYRRRPTSPRAAD